MTDPIKLVQGDTRPQLIFSLTDAKTGAPIDVSAAEAVVRMKFGILGSDDLRATMVCQKMVGLQLQDGTVDYAAPYDIPGAGGRVWMDWAPEALEEAGNFVGEVEVTFADGTAQTVYDAIKFKVRPQFSGE